MKKTPQHILDFIEQHSEKHPPAEIAVLLNKEFGCKYTPRQISDIKSHYKFSRYKNPIQNPVIKNFVRKNAKGKSRKELTELVNKTFNTSFTQETIHGLKVRLKVTSELNTQFKKRHTPWNKGKKGLYYNGIEKTWFKKGHIPANHKPVGSERIAKTGYTEIKVTEPRGWMLKHRYLYEKHIGKIPPGTNVAFKDGNRQNFNLENLILVTKKEALVMAKRQLWSTNPEITQAGISVSKIILKTSELKERGHEEKLK